MEETFDDAKIFTNKRVSLFSRPETDVSYSRVDFREYRPSGAIVKDAPLSFMIGPTVTEYIDLRSIRLRLSIAIKKADGSAVTAADSVSLSNNVLNTVFRQVDVKLQQRTITTSVGTNHAYKALLDMLTAPRDGVSEEGAGFVLDRPGHMNSMDTNTGVLERMERTKNGQAMIVEGPLNVDILQQDRLLMDGVPLEIVLYPSSDTFALMAPDNSEKYSFKIEDALLRVPHVLLDPGVQLGHAKQLEHHNALYPYTRSAVKTFNIGSGTYTWSTDNVFQESVPASMFVALVDAESYNGKYSGNAFDFENMDVSYAEFLVQGLPLAGPPFQPNYTNKQYTEVFERYDRIQNVRDMTMVNHDTFPNGYNIFVFSLTQAETSPVRRGHTRLTLKFRQALDKAATVIVYGQFPALMEISKTRDITIHDP